MCLCSVVVSQVCVCAVLWYSKCQCMCVCVSESQSVIIVEMKVSSSTSDHNLHVVLVGCVFVEGCGLTSVKFLYES